jgi:hypothetical protein
VGIVRFNEIEKGLAKRLDINKQYLRLYENPPSIYETKARQEFTKVVTRLVEEQASEGAPLNGQVRFLLVLARVATEQILDLKGFKRLDGELYSQTVMDSELSKLCDAAEERIPEAERWKSVEPPSNGQLHINDAIADAEKGKESPELLHFEQDGFKGYLRTGKEVLREDGTPAILIAIDTLPEGAESWEAQFKPSEWEEWLPLEAVAAGTMEAEVSPVEDAKRYDVRMRTVNKEGVESEWYQINSIEVVGDRPEPVVTEQLKIGEEPAEPAPANKSRSRRGKNKDDGSTAEAASDVVSKPMEPEAVA